jgi:hypothetical protein
MRFEKARLRFVHYPLVHYPLVHYASRRATLAASVIFGLRRVRYLRRHLATLRELRCELEPEPTVPVDKPRSAHVNY